MRLIIGQYDYGVSRNMSADDVDGATNSKPKSIPKFEYRLIIIYQVMFKIRLYFKLSNIH